MKRHRPHIPQQPRKLWLPSQANDREVVEKEDEEASAGAEDASDEDDLDRLLSQYEAQAAQDLQQVRHAEQQRQQPGKQQTAVQRREAALEQPLEADNKGFKMLAAMGYRPGQGLGKSVEGRAEPIPLDVKQNRLGLGAVNKKAAAREVQRQRDREAAERVEHAQRVAEASIHAGRQRTAEQFAARREAAHLRKAQQVCESLDTAAGITSNHFWQPPPDEEGEEGAGPGASTLPPGLLLGCRHPLDRLLPHAGGRGQRQAVAHGLGRRGGGAGGLVGAAEDELLEEVECFRRDFTGPGQEDDELAEERRYAGSAAALQRHAPEAASRGGGPAQPALPGAGAARGSAGAGAVQAGWHELPVQQRLQEVLQYLREQYQYCLFCGCRYEDAADLYSNCPGLMEADHD